MESSHPGFSYDLVLGLVRKGDVKVNLNESLLRLQGSVTEQDSEWNTKLSQIVDDAGVTRREGQLAGERLAEGEREMSILSVLRGLETSPAPGNDAVLQASNPIKKWMQSHGLNSWKLQLYLPEQSGAEITTLEKGPLCGQEGHLSRQAQLPLCL